MSRSYRRFTKWIGRFFEICCSFLFFQHTDLWIQCTLVSSQVVQPLENFTKTEIKEAVVSELSWETF
jgi:hypothetical protein